MLHSKITEMFFKLSEWINNYTKSWGLCRVHIDVKTNSEFFQI